MNNINNNLNLLSNKIKCFIFDFDDTLYYGVNWAEWNTMQKDWLRNHFKNCKDKNILNALYIVLQNKVGEGKDIINFLITVEGNAQAYIDWRDSISGDMSEFEKKGKAVPMLEIKKFRKQCDRLNGKMYIVSNSTLKDVRTFAEFYKIDLTLFDDIYINKFKAEDMTKKNIYQKIIENNNFKPDEVMVIGNSYDSDILPAEQLSLHTFLCKDGFTYEEVVAFKNNK